MTATAPAAADPQAHRSPLLDCRLVPVVDWVSLDVRLSSQSQPRHVLDALEGSGLHVTRAEPLGATNSSRTSHRFRLRVQDPAGPDAVLQGLHRSLKVGENDITVQGLEVALDAYVPVGGDDDLAKIVAHMLRATATPPPGRLWITGEGKGNSRAADKLRPAELHQFLAGPYSGNIGKRDSDLEGLRAYLKRSDTAPGKGREDLPASCARLERWFLGSAVPFTPPTLAGWRMFKFTDLTPYFAQVQVMPWASGELRMAMDRLARQFGQADNPKARASHRRQSRLGVVRDTTVNEAIRVALRRLTTAQRGGKLLEI